MKRVLFSTVATAAGLVALLDFKSHGHPMQAVGGLPSAGLPGATTRTGASAPHSTRVGTKSAAPTTNPSPPAAPPRTVDGDAEQTPYGIVQVRLSLTGSKITNIKYLQLTATDFQSQNINGYAGPILLQQALQAQSANIVGVSGASYTSAGFAQSVQSALTKAGIR